eukprot:765067-Hanusia_phi.AAC.2
MPVLSQPAPAHCRGGATDSRPGSSGFSEPPPAVDAAGGEERESIPADPEQPLRELCLLDRESRGAAAGSGCPPRSYPSQEDGLPGLARDPVSTGRTGSGARAGARSRGQMIKLKPGWSLIRGGRIVRHETVEERALSACHYKSKEGRADVCRGKSAKLAAARHRQGCCTRKT